MDWNKFADFLFCQATNWRMTYIDNVNNSKTAQRR